MTAPSLADLRDVAERALARAEGDAQATATWDERAERMTVEVTCVIDGRAARAVAASGDGEALSRAGRAAALHARRPRAWPSPGLPDPVAGATSAGAAPAPPPDAPAGVRVETTATRVAIASSRGVRAAEERALTIAEARAETAGRTILLRAADPTPDVLAELAAQARALTADGREPEEFPAGEIPVVLGHDAVATLLDHLRPSFGVELDLESGPLRGRLGTRVAAAAVGLATTARGFDAEGIPRQRVVLIEAGVARDRVHDAASAARAGTRTTGHATRAAALAPLPEHLELATGNAEGVEALLAPLERGLYVPALSPAREAHGDAFRHATLGAMRVRGGEPAAPARDGALLIDPLAVLASVEALTTTSRSVPLAREAVAVVPALRATAGCRGV